MSDPEFPPVDDSQARAAEGTDFDEALRKAQDANRLNSAFGINPGEAPTGEQVQGMVDFQGAMDAHEKRVAENAAAMEGLTLENYMQKVLPTGEAIHDSDRPLDDIQQEQARENSDLEYITDMFGESTAKGHQEAAWKLLDEFIDKKGLSREAERQLRNHFLDIARGVTGNAEAPSEPTPEPTTPDSNPSPEGPSNAPAGDAAEAVPTDGEPQTEASTDETTEVPEPNNGPKLFDHEAERVFDVPKVVEGDPTTQPGENGHVKAYDSEVEPIFDRLKTGGLTFSSPESKPEPTTEQTAQAPEATPEQPVAEGGQNSPETPTDSTQPQETAAEGGPDATPESAPQQDTGEAVDDLDAKSAKAFAEVYPESNGSESTEADSGGGSPDNEGENYKPDWELWKSPSILERLHAARWIVNEAVDKYFKNGTPEHNRAYRDVAVAAAILAVGRLIRFGSSKPVSLEGAEA